MVPGTTRRSFGILAACAAASAARAHPRAAALPVPVGKPLLTILGKIRVTNVGNTAEFDRAMLERLGMSSFETKTRWYSGKVTFEGVLMRRLMEAVDAYGTEVAAFALDDYETIIPMSDIKEYGVLLALKRDGKYMPVRDKGPLFVVYPYDSTPELPRVTMYRRSAWQLSRLVVM